MSCLPRCSASPLVCLERGAHSPTCGQAAPAASNRAGPRGEEPQVQIHHPSAATQGQEQAVRQGGDEHAQVVDRGLCVGACTVAMQLISQEVTDTPVLDGAGIRGLFAITTK